MRISISPSHYFAWLNRIDRIDIDFRKIKHRISGSAMSVKSGGFDELLGGTNFPRRVQANAVRRDELAALFGFGAVAHPRPAMIVTHTMPPQPDCWGRCYNEAS
jgi:hypothetical protein